MGQDREQRYRMLGQTGLRVSSLGLGGAPLGGDFGPLEEKDALDVVAAALDAGITFIDTAPLYGSGESERRIGKGLKGRRQQVVLATKAVMRGETYSYDNVMKSVQGSLERLQTDYLDLLQLHELESIADEAQLDDTLRAFEELQQQGVIRAYGINAGKMHLLLPLIGSKTFHTLQTFARCSLIDMTALDELVPKAAQAGIGVINGSPLGMGLLTDRPAPFLSKHPAMLAEAERRMAQLEFLREEGPNGLVRAAMRFALGQGQVSVTLSGASSLEMLAFNLDCWQAGPLAEVDEQRVKALYAGKALWDAPRV